MREGERARWGRREGGGRTWQVLWRCAVPEIHSGGVLGQVGLHTYIYVYFLPNPSEIIKSIFKIWKIGHG